MARTQAEAWCKALHRSQQRMHTLTAGKQSAALADLGDWDAGGADEAAPQTEAPEDIQGLPAPPIIQIYASLGELALFMSGRVCDDWWPPQV